MTPPDDSALEAPARKKERARPRRGKWPAPRPPDMQGEATPPVPTPAKKKVQPAKQRRPNPAPVLWAKAEAAAQSARVLGETGDWDGAANRSYYAVFSAARAVLAGVRASLADSRGHGTIFRRFDKHLVKARGLDAAFGQPFIGRLSGTRWAADYGNSHVGAEAAQVAVANAERFLAAVEPFLKKARA